MAMRWHNYYLLTRPMRICSTSDNYCLCRCHDQATSRLSRSQVALQDLSPSEAQARGPIVGLLLNHSAEIDPAQLAQMLGMGGSMDLTPQLHKHRQVCVRAVA